VTAADVRWCSPCRRMLPLDAFGRDRSQPAGLSYRCRGCDRAKAAVYYPTPGAFRARTDRDVTRSVVLGAHGGACWGCGTDEALSVYRPTGGRLSLDEMSDLAEALNDGQDEDEVFETPGLTVSCAGCAPTSPANGRAAVERLRERILSRLGTAASGPPSLPRSA
jgi:ribosomal protein S27E